MAGNRDIIRALLFYAFLIGLLFIPLPASLRSGPCTPGLDFLLMMLLGPLSLLLLVVSLIRRFIFKQSTNTAFVHGLVFLGWLITLKTMQ